MAVIQRKEMKPKYPKPRALNIAQQILVACGVDDVHMTIGAAGGRRDHATKCGPGRRHEQGDGSRTAKQRAAGSYGRGLRNQINQNQAQKQAERLNKLMIV